MSIIEDKNLTLMDDIMGGITQADEWNNIQTSDPMITAASDRWSVALEQAETLLPKELYKELCDAHTDGLSAIGDAGILFGIHVADVIRDVSSRPADLSRHIMERMVRK